MRKAIAVALMVGCILVPTLARSGNSFCTVGANSSCAMPDAAEQEHGDPVMLADGNTVYRKTDFKLQGSRGELALRRTFNSSAYSLNAHGAWHSAFDDLELPTPFGRSQTCSNGINWWHNFYSFVYVETAQESANWNVLDPAGGAIAYRGCGSNCWAANEAQNASVRNLLFRNEDGSFRYIVDGGYHFIYSDALLGRKTGDDVEAQFWFLTSVVDPHTNTVIAKVHYKSPSQGLSDVPYIDFIENEDGTRARFSWMEVEPGQWVLSGVDLEVTTGGTASFPPVPMVRYTYLMPASGLPPILVQAKTYTDSGHPYGIAEEYSYGLLEPECTPGGMEPRSVFSVLRTDLQQWNAGQREVMLHRYNGYDGRVYFSKFPGHSVRYDLKPGTTWDPLSEQRRCSIPPDQCLHSDSYVRPTRDADASSGDGSGTTVLLFDVYGIAYDSGGIYGPRFHDVTTTCENHLGQQSLSCSPGILHYSWQDVDGLPALGAVQDRRGFWMTRQYKAPQTSGVPPQLLEAVEIESGRPDCSNPSCVTAWDNAGLDKRNLTYGYTKWFDQRVKSIIKSSVVSPTEKAAIEIVYADDDSLAIASIVRSGRSVANGVVVNRLVKTFVSWQDGRPKRVVGPCIVNAKDDPACATGPYKIVEFEYYDAQESSNRANKVRFVKVFPSETATVPLVTEIAEYSLFGMPAKVIEPSNGDEIAFEWNGDKIVSASQGAASWVYGYDEGRLAWTRRPDGSYDVMCHRRTDGACKIDEPAADDITWIAKSRSADGDTWSEKVVFERHPNGTVASEIYYECPNDECSGTDARYIRKVLQYDVDAQRRPTWRGWGGRLVDASGQPAFPFAPVSAVRRFDQNGNLTGLGHAYNAPESGLEPWAFCGGPTGGARCRFFDYDGLNRLIGTVDNLGQRDPLGSPVIDISCVQRDQHGNITLIVSGCSVTAGPNMANCAALPANCLAAAYEYKWDDFGNLIEVVAPNTGTVSKAATKFEHDAAGNVVVEVTPTATTNREYDGLGRLTKELSGNHVLASYVYDAAAADPCTGRGAELSEGRLARVTDSSGTTWYSYDLAGRVKELRTYRGDPSSSAMCAQPDAFLTTKFEYTVGGEVRQIRYPHGREVRYVFDARPGRQSRIVAVQALLDGSEWRTLVQNVVWEPFGRVRAYEIVSTQSGVQSVEYLLGDAAAGVERVCDHSRTRSDWTGRIREIWISNGALAEGPQGDVYRRTYMWKADQILREHTCVKAGGAGIASTRDISGYDRLLRVEGSSGQGGVSFRYDARGNRVSSLFDPMSVQEANEPISYDYNGLPTNPDRLTGRADLDRKYMAYSYDYDASGRVERIRTGEGVSMFEPGTIEFAYDGAARGGIAGAVTTAVVNGFTLNYWYNAQGRRWRKEYGGGVNDEFFWDGHRLLEDRGSSSFVASDAYPIDEYVWLDDRPVALIRAKFNAQWQKQPVIGGGDCSRNDVTQRCGVYYVVSDRSERPIVMIEASSLGIAGAELEPALFGESNSRTHFARSGAYQDTEVTRIALGTVPLDGDGVPLKRDAQVKFHLLDTNTCDGAEDAAYLADSNGVPLGAKYKGTITTPWWSDWAAVPVDGTFGVDVDAPSPDACRETSAPYDCRPCKGCTAGTCLMSFEGVSVEAFKYRIWQERAGAPAWLPLRYPGQYYDQETDLYENWHRYYDPGIGRYLQPEPLMTEPEYLIALSLSGVQVNPYAYAGSNPIYFVDRDGRIIGSVVSDWAHETVPWIEDFGHEAGGPGWIDRSADFSAGFGDFVSSGLGVGLLFSPNASLTYWARDLTGSQSAVNACSSAYGGGLLAGAIWGAAFNGAGYLSGREFPFTIGRTRWRIAPWGNRTGHPWGKYPHYHRGGPKGQPAPPGGSMKRHRPWEGL